MAVPKKRRSHTRTRVYHAAWKADTTATATIACANCGQPALPHSVCGICGFYKGKKVMVTKTEKSAAKKARKEAENK